MSRGNNTFITFKSTDITLSKQKPTIFSHFSLSLTMSLFSLPLNFFSPCLFFCLFFFSICLAHGASRNTIGRERILFKEILCSFFCTSMLFDFLTVILVHTSFVSNQKVGVALVDSRQSSGTEAERWGAYFNKPDLLKKQTKIKTENHQTSSTYIQTKSALTTRCAIIGTEDYQSKSVDEKANKKKTVEKVVLWSCILSATT